MYSDWGYKKKTRFWTNRKNFNAQLCNKQCGNMVGSKHKKGVCTEYGGGSNRLERYRIPHKLISKLYII
tara:strand:- start:429 stop:635 length:207 start_codon:yes stop_codon:yes gene_type:complete